MSDNKGSLDCLPIYSFLFPNEKSSSLYNTYDRSEVEDKLVIKIDQDGDHALKFSIANDISEVYGLLGIHECINGQKLLRAVIDIDMLKGDMRTAGVKGHKVFIWICCSFIRALYRILDCSWKDILKGLVIATSSDSSKCSYHILYAPALLIDHHELKAFTELVYAITTKKGRVKRILQFSLNNKWNELDYTRVQPPTNLGLKVKPQMLMIGLSKKRTQKTSSGEFIVKCFQQNSDERGEVFECDPSIAEKIQQENKKFLQSLSATETYEQRYVRPLSNEVLSTRHSYSNAITTKLNLKSYCDIDGNINLPDHKRVVCQIESLHQITNNYKSQSYLVGQSIKKLYKLIQEARRIIVMDNNNLTDLNIEWIKAFRKDIPLSIIHNTYQPQKDKIFRLAPNKETVLTEHWD
ncbi:16655_t:CDS:2 [Funneliformis geosporum]|uniref:16655_t:CDS:1 n=1 Tax=Funneliformis geosporum TaxID=1117311 RepID=A0A9W4WYM8_9GLOM|nr:16655_t:CDS:2 [Funneliformis geosporum]